MFFADARASDLEEKENKMRTLKIFFSVLPIFVFWLFCCEGILTAIPAFAEIKVLVFDTNGSGGGGIDFAPLSEIEKADGETISYTKVDNEGDLAQTNLTEYDIVHFGFCSLNRDGIYHVKDSEENIKNYVEGGGIISTTSQDDNGFQSGWLPYPIKSCESGDHLFEPTKEAGELFTKPNKIDVSANAQLDDNWCEIDTHFVVLAYQQGSKDIADFLFLEYGKGFYLLTTLDTRDQGNVSINKPMFENIMQFLVDQRKLRMAIIPIGKLACTWGWLKAGD